MLKEILDHIEDGRKWSWTSRYEESYRESSDVYFYNLAYDLISGMRPMLENFGFGKKQV